MTDFEKELSEEIAYDPRPKCDICGNPITGKKHPAYNEQFEIEEGLVMCDKCYIESLIPFDEVNG